MDGDPDLVHMEMQDTSGGAVTFHLFIYLMILEGIGLTGQQKFQIRLLSSHFITVAMVCWYVY